MKKVSNNFRESLRGIRQLNAIIGYYDENGYFVLATQDDRKLTTENEKEIITQSGIVEYQSEIINSVNPVFNSTLFKTTCKYVEIDCKNQIPVGTNVNVRIGVFVEEKNDYEYVNYGDFIIKDEPTYQADTKSYLMIGYDKMMESMVDYDSDKLSVEYPITHKDLVIAICNKFNWKHNLINYPNYDKEIKSDLYSGQNLTYRDILDDLNAGCGGTFIFDLNNRLTYKKPTQTDYVVEDYDLKNTNVDFGKKFGKINTLTITQNNETVINGKEDSESVEEIGRNELNINDNYLLLAQSEDFIDDLFDEINGFEYYLYDIDSTGLLVLEPLDMFTFRHNGIDYNTIMFNDDIKASRGLVETSYAEELTEVVNDYFVNNKEENKLNNALISIDKSNSEIVLKADSNGKVVQAQLKADADEGSSFNIKADNIDFESHTFNLTSDNININSENLKIDKSGYLILKSKKQTPRFKIIEANDTENKFYCNYTASGIYYIDTKTNENYNTSMEFEQNGAEVSDISMPLIDLRVNDKNDNHKYWQMTTPYSISIADYNNYGVIANSTVIKASGITTPIVTQTSKEESKKNFEIYENALEELKKTDIYKYNLTNENDDKKKHIGFVIGKNYNYSHDITTIDENNNEIGVELYSMVSVLWKAVQEQQDIIEELKQEIKTLKESDK